MSNKKSRVATKRQKDAIFKQCNRDVARLPEEPRAIAPVEPICASQQNGPDEETRISAMNGAAASKPAFVMR